MKGSGMKVGKVEPKGDRAILVQAPGRHWRRRKDVKRRSLRHFPGKKKLFVPALKISTKRRVFQGPLPAPRHRQKSKAKDEFYALPAALRAASSSRRLARRQAEAVKSASDELFKAVSVES